jgi:hypothetical protein
MEHWKRSGRPNNQVVERVSWSHTNLDLRISQDAKEKRKPTFIESFDLVVKLRFTSDGLS